MTDRKKTGVAFWATVVVIVVLVAYPLSVGPAFWIVSRTSNKLIPTLPQAYWPIGWLAVRARPVNRAVAAYARLGMRPGSFVFLPGNSNPYGK